MNNTIIQILSNSIHICDKIKNSVLKDLLFRYARTHLSKKQYICMVVKLASIDEDSELYAILNTWIENHHVRIMTKMLHFESL